MDKIDAMIREALTEADREILEEVGEPGFYRQTFGLLSGPNGWVNWVLLGTQSAMFFAAFYAGWRCFGSTDVLAALKWGLSAATLLIVAAQLKMALMPTLQANRILRALRRLELRLAQREKG